MNDKLMMIAIRKIPAIWISSDTNITRFDDHIIASNPKHEPIKFEDGRWKKYNLTGPTRR